MKTKKIYLFIITSLLGLSQPFIANASPYTNPSEFSLLSGSTVLLSPILIPISILDELSLSSSKNYNYQKQPTKMTVQKITYPEQGKVQLETNVVGDNINQNITFQIPEKSSNNCLIKEGTEININKNTAGYTLNANNKVVGIIPNKKGTEYFNQEQK